MANNAVISISANIMTVQSMQGSIANFWWFSIGVQQWGAVTVYSNPQKYTFVIPFNEMCFYCGGIPWKIASGAYCGVAYTVSKIEFEMYYYYAGGATDVCWIAIGV